MVRSTKSKIEEFKNSMLWKDIQDELKRLSRNAQLEYDLVGEPHVDDQGFRVIPNESETLIHLGDIKGRRKAVNYFLDILEVLLQEIEDEKANVGKQETNMEVSEND